MSAVVHVNNISSQTSEQQVRDFFSFCGKITSLTVTPDSAAPDAPKKATVTFEKETAAKTALLLDNTQLGPSQVTVTAGSSLSEIAGAAGGAAAAAGESPYDENHIPQEEKPRSRIFAEYLAHGYTIGDKALEQALALDQKHGISNKFTQTLQNYNEKYNVTEKARAMDQNYGVSNKGLQAWAGLHSYFEKAVNTPTGQRLVDFYSNANQQVIDIHNEARRLADIRAGKDPKTAGPTGMSTEEATRRNEETKTAVPGTNKTVCQCAGNDGTCACKSGECACSGCAKSGIQGDHTATGQADVVGATAAIQPLPEKSV